MRLRVHLDYKYIKAKPWIETHNGYFFGSVFIGEQLLSEQEIKTLVENIKTIEQAINFVKKLNGNFAFVTDIGGTVFMAADRERTIPVFYEIKDGDVIVYNHISLDMIKARGINEQALNELDNCLFVSGCANLANGITAVMAGEAVMITDVNVNRRYYHEFNYVKNVYPDKDELFKLLDQTFIAATNRLIKFLDGRCAIVPLSGGHDSRLVVYYLKRLGYNNVLTYTYGPKGNIEATTSEKVAKFLQLEWHFVEYEPKRLQKLFNDKFEEVLDFCSNGVSSVCIQDWYAVDTLHKSGVFPENSVFVPGHSFDAIAGSFILLQYVENETVTKQQLVNDIICKHYSEGKRKLPPDVRNYFENKIYQELLENEPDVLTSDRAFNLYQNYNLRERQAKYICCQLKLYEYYGFDWYLPLWDSELIAFWETIEIKCKYNRKLFFEFTVYQYGDLMEAAPVLNEKRRNLKRVNMNPFVRMIRKIYQLINYVNYHYCLAYFTWFDVFALFLRKRVLNIGYIVNQKVKEIIKNYS